MTGELSQPNEAQDILRRGHADQEATSFVTGEGGEPVPTIMTVSGGHAESHRHPETFKKPLYMEESAREDEFLLAPEDAAPFIEALASRIFIERDPYRIRLIDTSRTYEGIDPPQGPAIVGLMHTITGIDHKHEVEKPGDLIAAQRTTADGMVTVEWHHVNRLDTPGPCGTGDCVRMRYAGGTDLEVQDITGRPVTVEDPRVAFLGLRWVLGNLSESGAGYDASPQSLRTNTLTYHTVQAGHQLTIPDALAVSRALQLPYRLQK